jgi:hypothetical protein
MAMTVGAHTHASLLSPSLGGAGFASALPLRGLSVADASLGTYGNGNGNGNVYGNGSGSVCAAPLNPLGVDFGSGSSMRVGPPQPQAAVTPALDGGYQTLVRGDLAGAYTDPHTGEMREFYTAPMPEPRVMRATPVMRLGEPSRALELMTGVSSLSTASAAARQCRPAEMERDMADAMLGARLPQGMTNEWVRGQQQARAARETFWTNNEVPAGFNDRHPDGCIGTTFVMRPVIDTQTQADNSETNTIVNPRGSFLPPNAASDVVDLGQAATRFGGPLAPAVTVLAEDQTRGVTRPTRDSLAHFGEAAASAPGVPVFDRPYTEDARASDRAHWVHSDDAIGYATSVPAPVAETRASGTRDTTPMLPTSQIQPGAMAAVPAPTPTFSEHATAHDSVARSAPTPIHAATTIHADAGTLFSAVRDAGAKGLRDMAAAVSRFVMQNMASSAYAATPAMASDAHRAARDSAVTASTLTSTSMPLASMSLPPAAQISDSHAVHDSAALSQHHAGRFVAVDNNISTHTAPQWASVADTPGRDAQVAPRYASGAHGHLQHPFGDTHGASAHANANTAFVHDAGARELSKGVRAPLPQYMGVDASTHASASSSHVATYDGARARVEAPAPTQRYAVGHETAPASFGAAGAAIGDRGHVRDAIAPRRDVVSDISGAVHVAPYMSATSERAPLERPQYGPRVGTDRTLLGLVGALNNVGFAAAQTSAPPLSFAPIVEDSGAAASAAQDVRVCQDATYRELSSRAHPSTFGAGAEFRNEYTLAPIAGREDANATTEQLTLGGAERRAREALLARRASRPATPHHRVMNRAATPLESDVDSSASGWGDTDDDDDMDSDSDSDGDINAGYRGR